jgi:signal transduction histidine kinase
MKATEGGPEAFAALAAHELQEPVRKLQMFADLLEPGSGATPEEAAEAVARMREAARRMGRLVQDLLEYTRAARGTGGTSTVDLAAAAAEAARESVPPEALAEGALEIAPLPMVPGDAAQLKRLLGCLLSNAFKFRRPGVPPRVSVRGRPGPAGRLEVSVADNGLGFEAEHAERIFEPFERLHRRTDYAGSGLGLALAARLAANHGGSVRAQAVLGEGAVFTLTLPLKRGG